MGRHGKDANEAQDIRRDDASPPQARTQSPGDAAKLFWHNAISTILCWKKCGDLWNEKKRRKYYLNFIYKMYQAHFEPYIFQTKIQERNKTKRRKTRKVSASQWSIDSYILNRKVRFPSWFPRVHKDKWIFLSKNVCHVARNNYASTWIYIERGVIVNCLINSSSLMENMFYLVIG